MINSTLCYPERDGCYLMLHRVKKENDMNRDKWLGIGGKVEDGESPDAGMCREVREETGLTLSKWRSRGIVTFLSDRWETEYMFLFTATEWTGELTDCDEGELAWVKKSEVPALPLWEGDRIFFRLLEEEHPFFYLTLRYEGEMLTEAVLDGRKIL